MTASVALGVALIVCTTRPVAAQTAEPAAPTFTEQVQPLLKTFCYECHGEGAAEGGLQLDAALAGDRQLWGPVWENLLTETMPPPDAAQPTPAERRLLSEWIATAVFQLDPRAPDPGRVTIRRLNREEYRYSVLDLLGIDFPVAEHFPTDDTGYGFDTIGDVLTISPTLMDKYFSAAEQISQQFVAQGGLQDLPPATTPAEQLEAAAGYLRWFARRAYRQPVDAQTVQRLLSHTRQAFLAGKVSYETLVTRALVAVLVSPRFLYRAEFQPGPDDPASVHPLDEYALAARLAYFLWSSVPDERLLELAAQGALRAQLRPQVERMVRDPKSRRMVENFVGQWLQMRDVEVLHKSDDLHQQVDALRYDMRYETEALFEHVMHENLDVLELITADYSFLTEALARFYGVPDVTGSQHRKVHFPPGSPRGGILTHGSVLLVTSNPDRTSPVKRGQFVLKNILGTPMPPAPQGVPALEEITRGVTWHMSVREQLAIHRENPSCAVCHDRMDPLGLGFEHFDAIGRWREDDDGFPIDATGVLVTGETFDGAGELRAILSRKRHLFYRCLTQKLMTYALGRGLEYTDNRMVQQTVDALMAPDRTGTQGRFMTLLMGLIESPQFQLRRGNQSQ